MPLLDHFGLLAPFYDRAIRAPETEHLIQIINLPVQGILLDAGGGTGRIGYTLRGLVSGVVVADLSYGMLIKAKEKDGLKTVCSHSEALPFEDNSFERVVMVDALHHVCDHRETVQELWRVLKPGGRIVIEEPDITTGVVKVVALAEKMALMRSHFISPKQIMALFPYADARHRIERKGYNVWVIVDKLLSG